MRSILRLTSNLLVMCGPQVVLLWGCDLHGAAPAILAGAYTGWLLTFLVYQKQLERWRERANAAQ